MKNENIYFTTNNIYYQTLGAGNKVFLLLHNAGGNHEFLYPQIEMLKSYGKVIAVDLPGHGNSEKLEQDYSVENIAKVIVDFCKELCIIHITCVGLNYGANIFIEIANQQPDLIKSLIMIDPPLFLNDHVKTFIINHIKELEEPNFRNYAENLVNHSFIRTSEHNKRIALQAFSIISKPVLAAVYKNLLVWDEHSQDKVRRLNMSSLCIFTDASLCTAANLTNANPQIKTAKVVDSLYWASLEVPDQVNEIIKRFLLLK